MDKEEGVGYRVIYPYRNRKEIMNGRKRGRPSRNCFGDESINVEGNTHGHKKVRRRLTPDKPMNAVSRVNSLITAAAEAATYAQDDSLHANSSPSKQLAHFSHCEFSYAAPDFEVIENDDNEDFAAPYSVDDEPDRPEPEPDVDDVSSDNSVEALEPRIVEVVSTNPSASGSQNVNKSSHATTHRAPRLMSDEVEASCSSPTKHPSFIPVQMTAKPSEMKKVINIWKDELDKLFEVQRKMIKDQAKSVEFLYNTRKTDIEALNNQKKSSLNSEKLQLDRQRHELESELKQLGEKQEKAQQHLSRLELETKRLERSINRACRLAITSLKKTGPIGQRLAYRMRRHSFHQMTRDRWLRKCLLAFGACLAMIVESERKNSEKNSDFFCGLAKNLDLINAPSEEDKNDEKFEEEEKNDEPIQFLRLQQSILRRHRCLLDQMERDIKNQITFERKSRKLCNLNIEETKKKHSVEVEKTLQQTYPSKLRKSLSDALGENLTTKMTRIELLSRSGTNKFREAFLLRSLKTSHMLESLAPSLRSSVINFVVNQKDSTPEMQFKVCNNPNWNVRQRINEVQKKMAEIKQKKKDIAMTTINSKLSILSFEERKLRNRLRHLLKEEKRYKKAGVTFELPLEAEDEIVLSGDSDQDVNEPSTSQPIAAALAPLSPISPPSPAPPLPQPSSQPPQEPVTSQQLSLLAPETSQKRNLAVPVVITQEPPQPQQQQQQPQVQSLLLLQRGTQDQQDQLVLQPIQALQSLQLQQSQQQQQPQQQQVLILQALPQQPQMSIGSLGNAQQGTPRPIISKATTVAPLANMVAFNPNLSHFNPIYQSSTTSPRISSNEEAVLPVTNLPTSGTNTVASNTVNTPTIPPPATNKSPPAPAAAENGQGRGRGRRRRKSRYVPKKKPPVNEEVLNRERLFRASKRQQPRYWSAPVTVEDDKNSDSDVVLEVLDDSTTSDELYAPVPEKKQSRRIKTTTKRIRITISSDDDDDDVEEEEEVVAPNEKADAANSKTTTSDDSMTKATPAATKTTTMTTATTATSTEAATTSTTAKILNPVDFYNVVSSQASGEDTSPVPNQEEDKDREVGREEQEATTEKEKEEEAATEVINLDDSEDETLQAFQRVSSNFLAGSDLGPTEKFLFDIGLALVRRQYYPSAITEETGDPLVEASVRHLKPRQLVNCNWCSYQAFSRSEITLHCDSQHCGETDPFPGPLPPRPEWARHRMRYNEDTEQWDVLCSCLWCDHFSYWRSCAGGVRDAKVVMAHIFRCKKSFQYPYALAPYVEDVTFITASDAKEKEENEERKTEDQNGREEDKDNTNVNDGSDSNSSGDEEILTFDTFRVPSKPCPWSCEVCTEMFPGQQSAFHHMEKKHQTNRSLAFKALHKLRCRICQTFFGTIEGFLNHIVPRDEMLSIKDFDNVYACSFRLRCPVCPMSKSLMSLHSWPTHFSIQHPDITRQRIKNLVCPFCYPIGSMLPKRRLPDAKHLVIHLLRWHNISFTPNSEVLRSFEIDLDDDDTRAVSTVLPLGRMFGLPAVHCSICGVRVLLHQMLKHMLRRHTRPLRIRLNRYDEDIPLCQIVSLRRNETKTENVKLSII